MGIGMSLALNQRRRGSSQHPGETALSAWPWRFEGSDLVDGATGAWPARQGATPATIGATTGAESTDPTVSGGRVSGSGAQYVKIPATAAPDPNADFTVGMCVVLTGNAAGFSRVWSDEAAFNRGVRLARTTGFVGLNGYFGGDTGEKYTARLDPTSGEPAAFFIGRNGSNTTLRMVTASGLTSAAGQSLTAGGNIQSAAAPLLLYAAWIGGPGAESSTQILSWASTEAHASDADVLAIGSMWVGQA